MKTAIPALLVFLDCFIPLARRLTWAPGCVVAVICPGLVGAALSCISFACELVPWAITTPPGVGSAAEALLKPPVVRVESRISEVAVAVKSFVFMLKVYPE